MRKSSAIFLAAFYLLLTTGAFACIIHCTEMYIFQPTASFSSNNNEANKEQYSTKSHDKHGKEDKHEGCSPVKDDDCCLKKHGLYVVKENLKENFKIQVSVLYSSLLPASYVLLPERQLIKREMHNWPHSTGPPQSSRIPIYLLNRTLLI